MLDNLDNERRAMATALRAFFKSAFPPELAPAFAEGASDAGTCTAGWRYYYDDFRRSNIENRNKYTEKQDILHDEIYKYATECSNGYYYRAETQYIARLILFHALPARGEEARNKIAIHKTYADMQRDRRVAMKPGRALRALFPHVSDVACERFATWWNEGVLGEGLTLHQSKDADDFKRAYSGEQAPFANPATQSHVKSLANSCMRHNFAHQTRHPAEAYASGDFAILWAEDHAQRIAARCVVYTAPETPRYAPIYCATDAAMALIKSALDGMGAKPAGYGDWKGARLARLEDENNEKEGFAAPYLDIEPRLLTDTGEYLTISERGEINASDYSGILGDDPSSYACCEHCGGDIATENDARHSEGGYCYCESCYNELYAQCENCECETAANAIIEVYLWRPRQHAYNNFTTQSVCRQCVEDDYTYCDDDKDYWFSENVYRTADDDFISPLAVHNGDYMPDISGEYVIAKYDAARVYDAATLNFVGYVHVDDTDEMTPTDAPRVFLDTSTAWPDGAPVAYAYERAAA